MIDTTQPVRPVPRWLHIGAIFAVAVTLFPLILGQIVTTIRAGMADPLWPTEPWYLINNYKFDLGYLVEHSHRIAGFVLGSLFAILTLGTWLTDPRPVGRWGGGVAVVVLTAGFIVGYGAVHRAIAAQTDPSHLPIPTVPLAAMGGTLLVLLALGGTGIVGGVAAPDYGYWLASCCSAL
jgi:heme A synthase